MVQGIYARDLRKGDRVVFRCHQRPYLSSKPPVPPILQRWIDTHDIKQRTAVYIGSLKDNSCNDWRCFLLDSPLNEAFALTDLLTNFVNRFFIDEKFMQFILIIDALVINRSVIIDRCGSLDDHSVVVCSMPDCHKMGYARDFIRLCDVSHCICWSHGSSETRSYKQAETELMKEIELFAPTINPWYARLYYYAISKASSKFTNMDSLCKQYQLDCISGRYGCDCSVSFVDLENELISKSHLKQQENRPIKRASPTTPNVDQLALDHHNNHDNIGSGSDQNQVKKARLDSSPPKPGTDVTDWLCDTSFKRNNSVDNVENAAKTEYEVILESRPGYSSLLSFNKEKLGKLVRTAESNTNFSRGTIKAVLRELDFTNSIYIDEDDFSLQMVIKQSERESQSHPDTDDSNNNNQFRNVIIVEDDHQVNYQASPPRKTHFYGKKLNIFIERPDNPEMGIKQLVVRSDMSYDDVLRLACLAMNCNRLRRDMMLVRQDPEGWNYKLEYELLIRAYDDSLWEKVYGGDLLQLRKITSAFLGGRYKLSFITTLEKYNYSIAQKIERLNEDYEGYLEIRGDGNCYYRAVIYGLLEQIIFRDDRQQCFRDLNTLFSQIKFAEDESQIVRENHEKLLIALDKAAKNEYWMTLKELESDILNESTCLDRALIVAGKRLVRDYLHDNQDSDWNGLSLKIAVMSYERYQSFDEYLENEVMKMGECAEGPHVDIGVLPMLLNAYAEIVMLDRNETVGILKKGGADQANTDVHARKFAVSLLFRPGHYDLLYRNEVLKKLYAGSYNLPPIENIDEIGNDTAMIEAEETETVTAPPMVKMRHEDGSEEMQIWNEPKQKLRLLPNSITTSSGKTYQRLNNKYDTKKAADLITGNNNNNYMDPKDKQAKIEAFDKAWRTAYLEYYTSPPEIWKNFAHLMHFEYGFDLDTIFDCYAAERPVHHNVWVDSCFQWQERKQQQKAEKGSGKQQSDYDEAINVPNSCSNKVSSGCSNNNRNGVGYNQNAYMPPRHQQQRQEAPEIDYDGMDPNDAIIFQQAVKDCSFTSFQVTTALPSIIKLLKEGFSLQDMVNAIDKEGILSEDDLRAYCLKQVAERSPPPSPVNARDDDSDAYLIDPDEKKKKKNRASSSSGPFTANMAASDIAKASPVFPPSRSSVGTTKTTDNQRENQESQNWLQKEVKNKEEKLLIKRILEKVPPSVHNEFKAFYPRLMKKLQCKLTDIAAAVDDGMYTEFSIEKFIRKNIVTLQALPPVVKTFGRFNHFEYQSSDASKKKCEDLPHRLVNDDNEDMHTQPQALLPSPEIAAAASRIEEFKKTMAAEDLQQLKFFLAEMNVSHREEAEFNILSILSDGLYPMELVLRVIRDRSERFSLSAIDQYCKENVGQYFEKREEQEVIAQEKRAELNSQQQRLQQRNPLPDENQVSAATSSRKAKAAEKSNVKDEEEDMISLDSTISYDQVQLQEKSSPTAKKEASNGSSDSPRSKLLSQEEFMKIDNLFKKVFYYNLYDIAVSVFDLPSPLVIDAILEKRCFNLRMIIREVLNTEKKLNLPIEESSFYQADKKDDRLVTDLYCTAVCEEAFDRQIVLELIALDIVKTVDEIRFKYEGRLKKQKALSAGNASSTNRNARNNLEGMDKKSIYNSSNVQAAIKSSVIKQRPKSAMRNTSSVTRDTGFSSPFSGSANSNVTGSGRGGTNNRLPTSANSQLASRSRPSTPNSLTRKSSEFGCSFTPPQPLVQLSSPRSASHVLLRKEEQIELKNVVFGGDHGISRPELRAWLSRFGHENTEKMGQPELKDLFKQVRSSYFASIKKK